LRNCATENFPDKVKVAFGEGLNAQMDFTKLTRTARLFLMAVHGAALAGDGFAVGHTGFRRDNAYLEAGLSAADGNFDMLVAHTLKDGLVGRDVIVPGEGHILFALAGQGRAQFGRVGLGFGVNRHAVEGTGVIGPRQGERVGFVTQRVAGGGFGELGNHTDITAVEDFDADDFFTARDADGAKAFFDALVLVPDPAVGADHARVHSEKGLLAHKGVGSGLPDIGSQRATIGSGEGFIAIFAFGNCLGSFSGRRKQSHDGVEERTNADFGRGGRYKDRVK